MRLMDNLVHVENNICNLMRLIVHVQKHIIHME